MRGKEWYLQGESPAPGITPAYAGKSGMNFPRRLLLRDHPRVCGEKYSFAVLMVCMAGSPPRMRGKEGELAYLNDSSGITPAYAGKSFNFGLYVDAFRDHPRVCGEKG